MEESAKKVLTMRRGSFAKKGNGRNLDGNGNNLKFAYIMALIVVYSVDYCVLKKRAFSEKVEKALGVVS